MEITRIAWTENVGRGYSGWSGEVNGKKLFTINWSAVRGEGWKLTMLLPFAIRKETLVNKDDQVLKELAERILVAFVKKLGAQFPEESE